MGNSYVRVPPDSTGKKLRTRQRTVGADTVEEQYVIQQNEKVVSFHGKAATFKTPGRGGTTGQKLFAIHNATGSGVLVDVRKIGVDVINTAVRAITVQPALIRLWRFTAVPTNGNAVPQVPMDTALSSAAAVTTWGDASADNTLSASALAVTLPASNMLHQEYGPRNFTAVGQEAADRVEMLESEEAVVRLRALEGVCVFLDYTVATWNPATDFWTATCEWIEYTLP